MARNVEIKARISQPGKLHEAAAALADHPAQIIEQQDVFFNVNKGRLKLRFLSPSYGQLIFYRRDDIRGPKTSTYSVVETDRPDEFRALLGAAFGERAIVRKQRHLYLVGRTRIHLDSVEGLGNFLELEVVLKESESLIEGEREAGALMEKLGVDARDLIEGAYVDLLAVAE